MAVFLTLVAHDRLFRHSAPSPPTPTTLVGKTISLPGHHFPAQRDTLVLVVSTSCHFCNESLPFYRQLIAQIQGRIDTVALLPQTQVEAETWFKGAGIS